MTTALNIESIVWVKNEIDQELELVREQLENYLRNPEDIAQIKSCRDHLHKINGVIEILGLKGVATISRQMEKLIEVFIDNENNPELKLDLFSNANLALSHYLGELINGVEDNPFRLFPAYQDLLVAHGRHGVSEGALFFPDLRVRAPLQDESLSLDAPIEAKEATKRNESTKFQVSLLKWLRDTADKSSLQQMLDVIKTFENIPASIEQKTFWWVSHGFFDVLLNEGVNVNLSVRKLCARIEQEIRRLDNGTKAIDEQLMRELLYQVSRGKIVTERIREIFNAYGWHEQIPTGEKAVEKEKLEPTLEEMQAILVEVKDAWIRYYDGQKNNLSLLITHVKRLKELAAQINYHPLEKLIAVIGGTAAHLNIQPQAMSEILAQEYAISLLLVEGALDNFNKLSPEFIQQVEIISIRLRSAVHNKWDEGQVSTHLGPDGISSKAQEIELMKQLSHECSANLKQIEDVLDGFFRDPTKSYELPILFPLFIQISGIFVMLEYERANALLMACRDMIEEFSRSGSKSTQSEHIRLAEGLSSIGFFIEALKYEQHDRNSLIESAINQFGSDVVAAAAIPLTISESTPVTDDELAASVPQEIADLPTEQTVEASVPGEANQGAQEALLAVFLEESTEALTDIATYIQACRNDPGDQESLKNIRRGFHTLKGSGRIVGLLKIAEVAWNMEQILDRWVSEGKSVTDELLDLISKVHHEFCGWCESLKEQSKVQQSTSEFLVPTEKPISGVEAKAEAEAEAKAKAEEEAKAKTEEEAKAKAEAEAKAKAEEEAKATAEAEAKAKAEEEAKATAEEEAKAKAEAEAKAKAEAEAKAKAEAEAKAKAEEETKAKAEAEAKAKAEAEAKAKAEAEAKAKAEEETKAKAAAAAAAAVAKARLDAQTESVAAASEIVTEAKPNIVIGEAVISPELFEVFTNEVKQHLATLESELDSLIGRPDKPVSHEFVLAAHTLAGISRNLKLEFIADIGHVMEQWLTFLSKKSTQPDQSGLQLMRNVIELLGRMLSAVCDQRLPDQVDLQAGVTLSHEMALMPERTEQVARKEKVSLKETAKPETFVSPQNELPSIQDNIDPELLETFMEETSELMPVIGRELRSWRADPKDENFRKALLRALHTLKGSARIAGAMSLGELIHNMESCVEAAPKESELSTSFFDSLENESDRISEKIEHLQTSSKDRKTPVEVEMIEEPIFPESSQTVSVSQPTKIEELSSNQSEEIGVPLQKTLLRVHAELIDHLVNESGEVSIARSRIETELHNFKQSLLDLTESTVRLRNQLREVEIQAETQMQSHLAQAQDDGQSFDPLEFDQFTRFQELTRLMAESVDDVFTVQQSMLTTHNAAEEALTQQARMNRDLQQALTHIRTMPFSNFAEHFYRVVRQAARDLNKKAILRIQGGHIEMDRSVLEKINSPLEHLLRNSVAHGIEEPKKRLEMGKPEIGQITIALRQEGNEIVMTLNDDGAGLDIDNIRKKALQQGLMRADETLSEKKIISFIFTHGLSTVEELSEVAGRGVGLDVVKNEITSLGGRVEVASEVNTGVTFTIYLPLTLAVAQTLMVQAGGHTYAIPTTVIEHVWELDSDALNTAYKDHRVVFSGNSFLFAYFPRLLGDQVQAPEIKRHNKILLLQSGALRLAVHVDELIGNSEVVVKNIGAQLARVPGVEGAAVMGDGHIILIINPLKLMHREETQSIFSSEPPVLSTAKTQPEKATTVMVVDDSLTVRKITSRLLEREGCDVLIAKDGLDATQLLQDIIPDVMLVDLEMPRMDGFELIKTVRSNSRTANIPIIVISSRTAEKHRNVAKQLGVNAFLGKPYKEDELLKYLTEFIKP